MIEKKRNKLLYSRLRILFITVILLFTILIIRLGKIQIAQGEEFRAESQKTKWKYWPLKEKWT